MTKTIEKQFDELKRRAERIKNDDLRVFGPEWSVGDVSAQGDLLIVNIGQLPASATSRRDRQMADGDTMGSRHIVARGRVYDANAEQVAALIAETTKRVVESRFVGPLFTGPALLTHPEHGDQEWAGACVNAVVYQRVWDAEQSSSRLAVD